jgi:hypothetical protein
MLAREDHADPGDHADDEADDETEPGRITHRALGQIENPGRFVFVHETILNGGLSRCNYSHFAVFFRRTRGRL